MFKHLVLLNEVGVILYQKRRTKNDHIKIEERKFVAKSIFNTTKL